jgi:signal transduction histidine kinase
MLRGIAAFRWGAWGWMAAVLIVQREDLQRAWLAWTLVAAAFAITAVSTVFVARAPQLAVRPAWLGAELAVGVAVSIAGGWAYASDPFSGAHNLGSAWPLAGVLSTGVVAGPLLGAIAAFVIALARFLAPVVAGTAPGDFTRSQWLSLASTTLVYVLGGAVAGYAATLLRRAEREVSAARAREEVARTLHDGVLQTLAIIERRADDPHLARLAREQERDLRAYLFGTAPSADGHSGVADLGPALMAVAARFEDVFGGRVDVVLAPDLPHVDAARVDAVAGAVGEALTNAGKHGAATRVTVYAEPDDDGGLVCSVRDDGRGFDVANTSEGVGLRSSVRGRVEALGGHAVIDSRAGEGTEVRLWVP